MFYEIKIKFNQSLEKLLIHPKVKVDVLIYISSRGGCRGDMCPGNTSARSDKASNFLPNTQKKLGPEKDAVYSGINLIRCTELTLLTR